MELVERQIRKLQLENGEIPFDTWFLTLDKTMQMAIDGRLARVRAGNFGDHKNVGAGVWELRIDKGPGLRVYFGQRGKQLVILVGGGDKSTQKRDIRRAQQLWQQFEQHAPKKL